MTLPTIHERVYWTAAICLSLALGGVMAVRNVTIPALLVVVIVLLVLILGVSVVQTVVLIASHLKHEEPKNPHGGPVR